MTSMYSTGAGIERRIAPNWNVPNGRRPATGEGVWRRDSRPFWRYGNKREEGISIGFFHDPRRGGNLRGRRVGGGPEPITSRRKELCPLSEATSGPSPGFSRREKNATRRIFRSPLLRGRIRRRILKFRLILEKEGFRGRGPRIISLVSFSFLKGRDR